jgi:hypothetical protein
MISRMARGLICAVAAVALAGTGLVCSAAETDGKAEKVKRKGPLKELPSKPGPHVAKIKAMGDGTWLTLGSPKADPKWGKARGRAWSPEMIYAPDMRGAFFMGTGRHHYVKPDGHYQDDLWFYDANAHKWICVYPGSPKNLKLKLDKRGFEVNEKGTPIPVDSTGHATCNSTYDLDRKKYMFIQRFMPGDWVGRHIPQRKEWLAKGKRADCSHPWVYDPIKGKWDRRFVEGSGPKRSHCSLLNYVPSAKKPYFLYGRKMWSFDWAASKWTKHATKGDPSIRGYNFQSCFDSKRQRIVQMLGAKMWFYDVKTDTGIDPEAKGQERVNAGGCNQSTLTYDTVNDVMVLGLVERTKRGKVDPKGLYVYDPKKNSWITETVKVPPEMAKQRLQVSAFYDPVLNAHIYFGAGDSHDKGSMWAYRYKRAKKK